MASTKKNTIVDVDVIETPAPKRKRTSSSTSAPKKRYKVEELTPIASRMGDDGSFDVTAMTAKEKEQYREIVAKFDTNDMGSLMSYGSELNKAMDSYATEFLNQRFSDSPQKDSELLVKNLITELKKVDLGDFEKQNAFQRFLSHIPILNKGIMTMERLKTKYYTMQESIDEIVKKLEAVRLRGMRDNTLLTRQYESNCSYIEQLAHLIIAGKIKSKEIEVEIENLKNQPQNYKTTQEISNLNDYKEQLDKRIYDLTLMRISFIQSLPEIKIIQKTNIVQASNVESRIALTIPLWKSNMSKAVALYNQKQGLDVVSKVDKTNEELMKANAEMMHQQAVEVAKVSQKGIISIDRLKESVNSTLSTITEVQKIIEEGAQEREKHMLELEQLEKEIYAKTASISQNIQTGVVKELRDVYSS